MAYTPNGSLYAAAWPKFKSRPLSAALPCPARVAPAHQTRPGQNPDTSPPRAGSRGDPGGIGAAKLCYSLLPHARQSVTTGMNEPQPPITRVDQVDWDTWHAEEHATLLFVVVGERVLLIRKKRGLGAGKINGPGGRLEPGETPLACAIREVQEELLITPRNVRARGELRFQSDDFPTVNAFEPLPPGPGPFYANIFVSQIDPAGDNFVFST